MDLYYGSTPEHGWLGDEDEGQMGSWYVMSAMGLFEMDGGASVKPIYEIGSPVFEKVIIHLDPKYYPGGEFIIEAKNVSPANRYIQSATLDDKPLIKPWFYHSELADGGKLVLKMGSKPNMRWGSRSEDAPPSLSSILTPEEKQKIMNYDKYAEDLEAWNKALKAYYYHRKEHFESLPNTEHEIIFLGNSITDQAEWFELFQNPNVKNRGISGDDTDGVLGRLDEVIESKPAKIFIMIGTNDLSYGKSVEYILGNYARILDTIFQKSPDTKIFIQSVLPTDDAIHYTRKNSEIIRINKELEELARSKGCIYIDLFKEFATSENKLNPEYSIDGLHLNGKGYELWKELIGDYVNE
jgi:lysophospholipase L1-like esterase